MARAAERLYAPLFAGLLFRLEATPLRRDQATFLGAGLVIGLMIGGVLGVVFARPELVGATSPAPRASSAPPQQAPASAAGDARERLAANPHDPHALLAMARTLGQERRFNEAASHVGRAIEHAGSDAHIYFEGSALYAALGLYPQALEASRAGLAQDRKSFEPAAAAFEIALTKVGDLQAAQDLLAEMGARAPGPEQVVAAKGQLDRVRAMLADADERPGRYESQVAAGNYYYDTKQWERSAAFYGRARSLRDDDPNMLTDYGTVLAELGRIDEAHELFERSILLSPKHWMAAYNGTIIALRHGDATRASEWVSRLRVANSSHPQLASLESQVRSLTAR